MSKIKEKRVRNLHIGISQEKEKMSFLKQGGRGAPGFHTMEWALAL
jgi:hypothetical protein